MAGRDRAGRLGDIRTERRHRHLHEWRRLGGLRGGIHAGHRGTRCLRCPSRGPGPAWSNRGTRAASVSRQCGRRRLWPHVGTHHLDSTLTLIRNRTRDPIGSLSTLCRVVLASRHRGCSTREPTDDRSYRSSPWPACRGQPEPVDRIRGWDGKPLSWVTSIADLKGEGPSTIIAWTMTRDFESRTGTHSQPARALDGRPAHL